MLLPLVVLAGCGTGSSAIRAGALSITALKVDYANTFVLPTTDGKVVLVDAGFPKNAAKLEQLLTDAGYAPSQVTAIILTHGHYDHAGAARHFQEHYGTRIVAGRGDQAMLARGTHDPICPTGFLGRQRYKQDAAGTFPPVTPDVLIDAPTPLQSIAALEGEIVPLPSHTPGSLIVKVGDAVLVGDLFRGSIVGSSAEVHFYICDLPGNHRDIRRLLDTIAPEATQFLPGHFGPIPRKSVDKAFP